MADRTLSAPETRRRHSRSIQVRRKRDQTASRAFFVLSLLPLTLIIVILVALILRSQPILRVNSIWALLSGQIWKPNQGLFGFLPYIIGTIWVTSVAMIIAIPPCLFTAIYLAEYASPRVKAVMKPLLDILASIPSVVYGVWGVVAIVPWVHRFLRPFLQDWLGFIPVFQSENPTGYSIISGSIVLAVMVAPFIIALTYEVIHTVPDGMRHASLAVGATRWQTVRYAVLPQTTPGIVAGIMLGCSRALGETMAVMMVVGNVAKIPASIFDPAYPLPALIANNFGEMMSIPLYDGALMGAALVLLVMVLIFNITSTLALRRILRRMK